MGTERATARQAGQGKGKGKTESGQRPQRRMIDEGAIYKATMLTNKKEKKSFKQKLYF